MSSGYLLMCVYSASGNSSFQTYTVRQTQQRQCGKCPMSQIIPSKAERKEVEGILPRDDRKWGLSRLEDYQIWVQIHIHQAPKKHIGVCIEQKECTRSLRFEYLTILGLEYPNVHLQFMNFIDEQKQIWALPGCRI